MSIVIDKKGVHGFLQERDWAAVQKKTGQTLDEIEWDFRDGFKDAAASYEKEKAEAIRLFGFPSLEHDGLRKVVFGIDNLITSMFDLRLYKMQVLEEEMARYREEARIDTGGGISNGVWEVFSKSDPRWNNRGRGFGHVTAGGPPEMSRWIEECREKYGDPPKDATMSFFKD